MQIKFRGLVAALLILVPMTLVAQAGDDGPTEGEERLIAPLKNAGIPIEPAALIKALTNNDLLIASRAALLLPRFRKSPVMVRALTAALSDDRELVAVTAAQSLAKLKEKSWTAIAVKRLPKLVDPVAKVMLAGSLADAGRGDGWPLVKAAVVDERYALLAVDYVKFFDGKRGPDGKPIAVGVELRNLVPVAPPNARLYIEKVLRELTARPCYVTVFALGI
jgi:hypothetical protein